MLTIINPASRFNRNQIVLPFNSHMFTTTLFLFAVFGNQSSNRYLINPKSTEGLMKLLDTFLLTVTCRGNVVLVSSSVEQYLGHCRVSCQRYFLLFMEFLWKSNARLESFHLKLTSRTAPFPYNRHSKAESFSNSSAKYSKTSRFVVYTQKPVWKALGKCCSPEFIFFQTRSRFQVQTVTNCPSPIKL